MQHAHDLCAMRRGFVKYDVVSYREAADAAPEFWPLAAGQWIVGKHDESAIYPIEKTISGTESPLQ